MGFPEFAQKMSSGIIRIRNPCCLSEYELQILTIHHLSGWQTNTVSEMKASSLLRWFH